MGWIHQAKSKTARTVDTDMEFKQNRFDAAPGRQALLLPGQMIEKLDREANYGLHP